MIYIVMGVSGVGKTTIGKLLAEKLGLPFYDADDFHSADHIQKMKDNLALTDEDRQLWLAKLAEKIIEWNRGEGAVLACSALRENYRKQLRSIPEEDMIWIYLHSEFDIILQRISERKDHYFGSELLKSQYKILESPEYGIHINVNTSIDDVIKNIMKAINKISRSEVGLIGLGVMGKSLALNFASKEVNISVYNRQVEGKEVDVAKKFAAENDDKYDFAWFDELPNFIASLAKPRNILLMVNAGKAVDMVIQDLLPFLDEDDLIIDGGNSFYKDTIRREKELNEKGILFMGLGISGGEEGARKGPSLMPGGARVAYDRVGSVLERIAAKDKQGNSCCAYLGTEGAGHFVKMVHNGIEYGEMQLIAEIYHFFRYQTNASQEDIAATFEEWNKEMQSFLLEISVNILRKKEDGEHLLEKVLDAAGQKGTGGWSTNAGLELGVSLDTITAAVMARNISAKKEERTEAMKLYESSNFKKGEFKEFSAIFYKALKAGSIINHAIGFDLLLEASKEYNWKLNLSEVARIWTNGCIIRSKLMEVLVEILKKSPEKNILQHPEIVLKLKEYDQDLTEAVSVALKHHSPLPVFSAAANYFLSYTAGQSSANMIQAQRDYFGAHTYERINKPRGIFFHSDWNTKTK